MKSLALLCLCLCLSITGTAQQKRKRRVQPKATPPFDYSKLAQPLSDVSYLFGEWLPITESTFSTISGNLRTQTTQRDGTIKMWVKRELKADSLEAGRAELRQRHVDYDPATYSYSKELYLFDCTGRRSKSVAFYDYDTNGGLLSSAHPKATWNDVVPESTGEAMLGFACRKQRGKK